MRSKSGRYNGGYIMRRYSITIKMNASRNDIIVHDRSLGESVTIDRNGLTGEALRDLYLTLHELRRVTI